MIVDEINKKIIKKNKGFLRNYYELYSTVNSTTCQRKIQYYSKLYSHLNCDDGGDDIFSEETESNLTNLFMEIEHKKHFNEFLSQKWKSIFLNAGIRCSEKDLYFSDMKHKIHGFLHLTIKIHNDVLGANIFTVSKENMGKVIDNGPFRSHIVENTMNVWLSELRRGLIIYDCFDQDIMDYKMFEISPSNNIVNSVCKKFLKIDSSDSLLDIPYENMCNQECAECPFRSECWKK